MGDVPPSTVARRAEDCPLCGGPIILNQLITMEMNGGWGHTACVCHQYLQVGRPTVVETIVAEAEEIGRRVVETMNADLASIRRRG